MKFRVHVLIYIFLVSFLSSTSFAYVCNNNLNIINEKDYTSFIRIIDSTSGKFSNTKKLNVIENVEVNGLTPEIFNKISKDPEMIAFLLGAKITRQTSVDDFRRS